jgi:hypothetical protein
LQALEALRKLRTEKVQEVKELKLKLEHTKTLKDQAQARGQGAAVRSRCGARARAGAADQRQPSSCADCFSILQFGCPLWTITCILETKRLPPRLSAAVVLASSPPHVQRLRSEISRGKKEAEKLKEEIAKLDAGSQVSGLGGADAGALMGFGVEGFGTRPVFLPACVPLQPCAPADPPCPGRPALPAL